MKKIFVSVLATAVLGSLFIASCRFKNNNNITPTYRNQSTGTGANPNLGVATVTGVQTVENLATQNSSIQAGSMAGWSFESCSTNQNMMVAHNGSTVIRLKFSGPIMSGTYALTAGAPSAGQVQMSIQNAPGQPGEVTWYSKSGSVVVTPIPGGYSASFSNIPCLQQKFLFPVVTVSGYVIC
jgi:hypothetical protein